MNDLVADKVSQASRLLNEFGLPLWIVQFARETYDNPQPVQELCVGSTVTWPAAFIITSTGESVAIVGTGDVAAIRAAGAYQEVLGYVQDIGPVLRQTLDRFQPEAIGISTSVDDDSADNLTHGMHEVLLKILEGTPHENRLRAADGVLVALRARKQPREVERIRSAIESTAAIITLVESLIRPGVRERDVGEAVHRAISEQGLEMAWDHDHDPIVNFGPNSSSGHAPPGDVALEPGMLVHVDLGVKRDGYCSDVQRTWYLPRDGDHAPPADVRRAFDVVARSMREGFDALRPGVAGWEVDAVARKVLKDEGYSEPEFSLGHQLGQTTHDGGALLGPRWARYGRRPEMKVEEGNVFTIEYSLDTSAGQVGLEEDVLVTATGAEYLTEPQTGLRLLRE